MYNTNNKNIYSVIPVSNVSKNIYYKEEKIFHDLHEVLLYVASHVNTFGYNNPYYWDYPVKGILSDEQIASNRYRHFAKSEYDDYDAFVYRVLNYHFIVFCNDIPFDLSLYTQEIIRNVWAIQKGLVKPYAKQRLCFVRFSAKKVMYPKSHTCYVTRRGHYAQRKRQDTLPDLSECTHFTRRKYKNMDPWDDCFWRRGECNWKTKKHRHQWEHRLGKKKGHDVMSDKLFRKQYHEITITFIER